MLKIKNIESFKLYYIYFFPVVFFPFLNIYQFRNDPDIKSWLFRNLLISFTVVVTLFFLALSMLITKFLYKDQNKNTDFFSVGLGFLCLIFLMGSNYYQFQKFSVGTDLSIDYYRMALMVSFLMGCFFSSTCFTLKYQKYSKKHTVDWGAKIDRFMASASLPLCIAIGAFFDI